jgi:hypothetical protein
MTEPEILDHVDALQDWLKVAWRQLSDPSLNSFDRRELRNQMKMNEAELRIYFETRAERLRGQVAQAEAAIVKRAKPELRLLGKIRL